MHTKHKLFEIYAAMLGALADEPDCKDPEARCKLLKACANGMRDAAQGHARYEVLRVINPKDFAEMWARSLLGERFDDMVDERAAAILCAKD